MTVSDPTSIAVCWNYLLVDLAKNLTRDNYNDILATDKQATDENHLIIIFYPLKVLPTLDFSLGFRLLMKMT